MIEKKFNNKDIIIRLLKFTKPYRLYMLLSVISAFVGVTLSLLSPVLIGKAIDNIIGPDNVNFNRILRILIYLSVTIVVSTAFQWITSFCTNKVTFHTIKDLRITAFRKMNKVSLQYIDRNSHGNIMNTIVNDIEIISDGLLQGFAALLSGIITILGTLVFMIFINAWIAFLVVILTPLSFFVTSFISKHTYEKFKEQSKIRGELSGYIEEMIGNQKIVKVFQKEETVVKKFSEINGRLHSCGVMAQFYSSMTNPCTRFVNGVVYAAVGIVGALRVIHGGLTIGALSSFLAYANQYTKPFNEISGVITELQSALASARRVFAIIDEQNEISDADNKVINETDGHITMEEVSFSYKADTPLIEHLNLDVKPGSTIAIVGPTGSGKSTLINLLMRFYDPQKGVIKVSGIDIKEMKRNSLRSLYGMVLQESWLFSGTIRDNIAFGMENATDEEIIEAAKAAHAHSFIKRLPNGYDTVISEDGGNISQGQKQLLCIARVMLTKPPMLILDEATSNIDTRTEIKIQKAFLGMMKGRTSFVVAHRLSTIKEADTILVMENGKIIEMGSHNELLEKNGFYANLYNSQFAVTG
jgi:ATP-binding cassette subfamily B protein